MMIWIYSGVIISTKIHLKISSATCPPFFPSLIVLSMRLYNRNQCYAIVVHYKTLISAKCQRYPQIIILTHWGRVTHICVSKLSIIGSDNGLPPGRRQAIIWTNAGILLIRPLGTDFSEILIEIYTFSFKKIHLKMSSGNGDHFVSASMS